MITYSLWLYEIEASRLVDFETAFREGGIVHESFRRIPGHIHTDLLRRTENPPDCCRLLSISFFTSLEALLRADQSAQMRAVVHRLKERANHCYRLGRFSLLPRPEAEIPPAKTLDQVRAELTPWEMPG